METAQNEVLLVTASSPLCPWVNAVKVGTTERKYGICIIDKLNEGGLKTIQYMCAKFDEVSYTCCIHQNMPELAQIMAMLHNVAETVED